MSAPIALLQQVPLFKGLNEKYLKSLSAEFTERVSRRQATIVAVEAGLLRRGLFVARPMKTARRVE